MSSQQPRTPTVKHARPRCHRSRGSGFLTGAALVVIGTLFLLHNLDVYDLDFTWRAWPLFLVLFGVIRLVGRSDRSSGLWLVAIGLWLYANENRLWDLDYGNSWPFLVVFAGLMMVGKALRGSGESPWDERPGNAAAQDASTQDEGAQDGGSR